MTSPFWTWAVRRIITSHASWTSAATHAVLSGPAIERLKATAFEEVIVTNTLPIPQDRRFDGLTVLSITPLIARAIREVFEDGSVTSLFEGQS